MAGKAGSASGVPDHKLYLGSFSVFSGFTGSTGVGSGLDAGAGLFDLNSYLGSGFGGSTGLFGELGNYLSSGRGYLDFLKL